MSERLQWTCTMVASTVILGTVVWKFRYSHGRKVWSGHGHAGFVEKASEAGTGVDLLPCITSRRSVFARNYVDRKIDSAVVQTLLDAAMWAPFHGPVPPWRFVVLGREAMIEMQRLSLDFYDSNWQQFGWASGKTGTEEDYQKWRLQTERSVTGRWGPVSFMIAIVMQRQAGSKRMPEWEEMAATASAVQNMHLQASAFPGLGCYWSSWHDAARDSDEMKTYLRMSTEDMCLGFFIVADACDPNLPDNRKRSPAKHLAVEWRA